MTPKVSVIMSVHNGEVFLEQAIDSVLGQSFQEFEFVIVDDASTDRTWDICAECAVYDHRIILLRNSNNIGLTQSLNRAIEVSKGEYIARQDADDISVSSRLEKQVQFLGENPDVGVVGTWVAYVDEKGKITGYWRPPTSPEVIKWNLLFGTCVAHPSVIMRKQLILKERYNPTYRYAQDYDLWLRLSKKTKIANIPEILYMRRVHPRTISLMHGQEQKQAVVDIMRKKLTSLLKVAIKEREVMILEGAITQKKMRTRQELRTLIKLIIRVYRAYLREHLRDKSTQRMVAHDVAQKLASVAVRHVAEMPWEAGMALCSAITIKPAILRGPWMRHFGIRLLKRHGA
ncbi:MAG: glycosyltransferase [Candidatus Methanomethylicaceae archaeon]